jgi:hypothetical protein
MSRMSYKKCKECEHVKIHYKGDGGKGDVDMPSDSFALICRLFKECIYVKSECPSGSNPNELGTSCSGLE